MRNNLFDAIKTLLVGHEVVINGCSFIPNGTHARITGMSFNLKDVLKLHLIDLKTMKVFDIDINNHQAMIDIVK